MAIGRGLFRPVLGVALVWSTDAELGGVRLREWRLPVDAGVRLTGVRRTLVWFGEASLVAALLNERALESTREDFGYGVGGRCACFSWLAMALARGARSVLRLQPGRHSRSADRCGVAARDHWPNAAPLAGGLCRRLLGPAMSRRSWLVPLACAIAAAVGAGCGGRIEVGSDLIWTARFESGALDEWTTVAGGGVVTSPPSNELVASPDCAHGGAFSAKMTMTTPANPPAALSILSREGYLPDDAYYSAWF